MSRFYTEADEGIIRKYAGIKTAEEIGLMVGRPVNAIHSKASSMKVSVRMIGEDHHSCKLSNLQIEILNALYVSGFKAKEIHQACFSHMSLNAIINRKAQ
jgi:hypothetical protein